MNNTMLFLTSLCLMVVAAISDEAALYNKLFAGTGYNTRVRPRKESAQTVTVDLELELIQINELVSN